VRRVIVKLHLLGGFTAAIFVIVLGVTGALMAFEEEIDHVTHPHLFRVSPSGNSIPLEDLGRRAAAAFPGSRIVAYGLGVVPSLSSSVILQGKSVYMNQYSGEILGVRSGPTWLNQVHQLHLRLLAGDAGKTIVSWAGVLMALLTCSGLYLWWPVKRVSIMWSAGGRRAWFDLHNAVGVVSFVFFFSLALTGVVIGFESRTVPLLYRITGSEPLRPLGPVALRPGAPLLGPDAALAAARAAMPGAAPVFINVAGPRTAYRIAMRFPEDLTPGGRTRVFVDPYTGAVLQAESSRTTAAGTRLVNLNRAIHTGDVFGVPTKILMSVASLAAVVQVVSGLMMWSRRRLSSSAARTPR